MSSRALRRALRERDNEVDSDLIDESIIEQPKPKAKNLVNNSLKILIYLSFSLYSSPY